MRIGPRDPATHAPKVGTKLEVIRPETSGNVYQPRMMKVNNVCLIKYGQERSGFSGGFKILEEFRKSKIKQKGLFADLDQDEDGPDTTTQSAGQNLITKDEIFQQLNLGPSDSSLGVGKSGTSKNAIAKDLVESMQKEIEKLRR